MEKEDIKERIKAEEKRVEAAKKKRDSIAMVAFAGVYLVILYFLGEKPLDFNDYFSLVFSAIVVGVMHHAINRTVYEHLIAKDEADQWHLKCLKEKLAEAENRKQ